MKKYKEAFWYVLGLIIFSSLIYLFLSMGSKRLEVPGAIASTVVEKSSWNQFLDNCRINFSAPFSILLVQIIIIVTCAKLLGYICNLIHQPSVIGEILAGILLGPTFIGHYFPHFFNAVFPAQSMGNLQFLSQIGLILFMFVVGLKLDIHSLKKSATDALVISHASILTPFVLGILLAYGIYGYFAPPHVRFVSFALFTGAAMSITAFPVLARIVQERKLGGSHLGAMVIACAAVDDITAWCMLAIVIAIVKTGTILNALYTIVLAIIYIIVMVKVVKPLLQKIAEKYSGSGSANDMKVLTIFLVTLFCSSFITEFIGIHALYGAFMAGVITPLNIRLRQGLMQKIESLAVILLLPLYFAYTGLRTQIGLLNDAFLWKMTACIILVAVMGKFLGSALSARAVGQSWHDSLSIGVLMNTRGLMELVILNIGYEMGIMKDELFAMMVIMAIVTTFLTGPLSNLINKYLPNPQPSRLSVHEMDSKNLRENP